jgi:hypothetical protein
MAVQSTTIYAIQQVRPGDLIVAALINSLIVAIKDLDDRVHKLETAPTTSTGAGPASPPAGLRITGANLTFIGQIPTINVAGSGFTTVTSFKINNIAFTPLGRPGDDDGMAIMVDVGPTANATIRTAIQGSALHPFTLTLAAPTGQPVSASVSQVLQFAEATLNPNLSFNTASDAGTINQ